MHSLSLQLKGFAVLCGCRSFLQDVADSDFMLPPGTTFPNDEHRERARHNSHERTIHRCRLLRKTLACSFLIIGTAVLAAGIIWVWINRGGLSLSIKQFYGSGSVVAFAWATLRRLGWSGQSMGGNTVFERLDDLIFRVLYWIGTFLGILALLI